MTHTLNASFYKWIDNVRRAYRKEKELYSYIVSYDEYSFISSKDGDEKMLFWLEKIKKKLELKSKTGPKDKSVFILEKDLEPKEN